MLVKHNVQFVLIIEGIVCVFLPCAFLHYMYYILSLLLQFRVPLLLQSVIQSLNHLKNHVTKNMTSSRTHLTNKRNQYIFHGIIFYRCYCVDLLYKLSTYSDCFRAFVSSSFVDLLGKQKETTLSVCVYKCKIVSGDKILNSQRQRKWFNMCFSSSISDLFQCVLLALSFTRANHYK